MSATLVERDIQISPLVRYPHNPIVPRDAVPRAHSIFNSAVIEYGTGYRGVFRIDDRTRRQKLHSATSKDAINWVIDPEPIDWQLSNPELEPFDIGYDPRVTKLDGRYYITWCHGYHGYAIGLGVTDDFESFELLDYILPPYNRNAVLFPRRINGKYMMLHRPSDASHTPFGDIFLSKSPDLRYWGEHRWVMGPKEPWEKTKIGAGPVPIETPEGWLLIYHGVLTSCNGFTYSGGVALLDLDEPWKVIKRSRNHILTPTQPYECMGDVPNVTFPCGHLYDEKTGEIKLYYGAADTSIALATCTLDELMAYLDAHNSM